MMERFASPVAGFHGGTYHLALSRGCTGDFSCAKSKKNSYLFLLGKKEKTRKMSWLRTQNNSCHPHNCRFPLSMMEANIDAQDNIMQY
jgi:hypothetical protein